MEWSRRSPFALGRLVGLVLTLAALAGGPFFASLGLLAGPALAPLTKTAAESLPEESEKEGEVDTEFVSLIQQRARAKAEAHPHSLPAPSLIHPPRPTTTTLNPPPSPFHAGPHRGAGIRSRC